MINTKKAIYKKIKNDYSANDIEETATTLRKLFTRKDEEFSVFKLISNLDTMVILFNDEEDPQTRYISFNGDEKKNYLVLSAGDSIEDMRFNASCMLAKLVKKIALNNNDTINPNITTKSHKFTREEKYFACALLMPKKDLIKFITQKDKNGKYIFFNENNEISFKNINIVADHFGVPFNHCLSRIYYVLESMRKEENKSFYIEGCYTKKEYNNLKEQYSEEQRIKDMQEVVPEHQSNRKKHIKYLLDSLHYRTWERLSDVAKRRLLVNLIKADSVNEGVVQTESDAQKIINNYIASRGTIYDGVLVTKDGEYELDDEQLVVLGEYNLYEKALERGLIVGIVKSNPRLEYLLNLSYEEAINSINEKDLAKYICDLHRRLYSNLSSKYGKEYGGQYRQEQVELSGTDVPTASPFMIPMLMDTVCWRILDVLKRNVRGELSNSDYVHEINDCIYEIIRLQPFFDGNKRTSRLLSNILYQEKGMPFVFVPTNKWDEYVDAWSGSLDDYNQLMDQLILDSYKYFYGDQTVSNATSNKIQGEKIINQNKRR